MTRPIKLLPKRSQFEQMIKNQKDKDEYFKSLKAKAKPKESK